MERKGDMLYGIMDSYTNEPYNYKKVITWLDGTPMNDLLVDGIIFVKTPAYPGEFFQRCYTGPVNVRWFGAVGDGETDDSAAFQRAIDAFAVPTPFFRSGVIIEIPRGDYIVGDVVVGPGVHLMSFQMPRSNFVAYVESTIIAKPGCTNVFTCTSGTIQAAFSNLNIDGGWVSPTDEDPTPEQPNANLKAAIRFSGTFSKITNCNINRCAQHGILSDAGLCCYIQDNFIAGWFGPAVFDDPDDMSEYKGALHLIISGDNYVIGNEVSATIPYFQDYPVGEEWRMLRDRTNGRICAFVNEIYGGNSVVINNIFENGDRCAVYSGCLYGYHAGNRYELSGMGGVLITGFMYGVTFNSERFADNSLSLDQGYDDLTMLPGAVGLTVFNSPIFQVLFNTSVPLSGNKSRYHVSNYASLSLTFVAPIFDSNYTGLGTINLTTPIEVDDPVYPAGANPFPVRQVIGQFYPKSPVYSSVRVGYGELDSTTDPVGFVDISGGTSEDAGNFTGIIGWHRADTSRIASAGFDNLNNSLSFTLTNKGQYAFGNGGLFSAADGGTALTLQSNDGLGVNAINMYSDPAQTYFAGLNLNAETGAFNILATSGIGFTATSYTFQSGNMIIAKGNGAQLGLLCADGTGFNVLSFTSDPAAAHSASFLYNNATGVMRWGSSDTIILGQTGTGSIIIQPNGLMTLGVTPTSGDTSDSVLLGRNSTTGELTIIDPALVATTPTFKEVTDEGNVTDNSVAFTSNLSPQNVAGIHILAGTIYSGNPTGTPTHDDLNISGANLVINAFVDNNISAAGNINILTPNGQILISANTKLQFNVNSGDPVEFNTEVEGLDATDPTHFTTLGQVNTNINNAIATQVTADKVINVLSTSTTLTSVHRTILMNNTGTVTLTLPPAVANLGREYTIKKVSAAANDVIIDGDGIELVERNTTLTLTLQDSAVSIKCDGSAWWIISSHVAAVTL